MAKWEAVLEEEAPRRRTELRPCGGSARTGGGRKSFQVPNRPQKLVGAGPLRLPWLADSPDGRGRDG